MLNAEVAEPAIFIRDAGTHATKYTPAVRGTRVGEIEVVVLFVVSAADAPQVATKLLVPAGDKGVAVCFDGFSVDELGLLYG